MKNLIMKDAEKARDAIMDMEKKHIEKLYSNWADEIAKKGKIYAMKSAPSYALKVKQMDELKNFLTETSKVIANEVDFQVKQSIYMVSDAVVKSNANWVQSMGKQVKGNMMYFTSVAYSSVPDSMVRKLVTGQIYDSGWSLSKSIWGDNEDTLSKLYEIIAGGTAMNESVYEISKKLEKYVRPNAVKPWNLKNAKGGKIYPKKVDYNAQRLVRTLTQHAYQQSFVEVTKDNPLITDYIWRSNGSRACPLCLARDGQHYKKDELPLDHPNGMCVMIPNVQKDYIDRLAKWVKEPDGTDPELDAFGQKLGYVIPGKVMPKTLEEFKAALGPTKYKSSGSWFNHLDPDMQKAMKQFHVDSGMSWADIHAQFYDGGKGAVGSFGAKGTESIEYKFANNKIKKIFEEAGFPDPNNIPSTNDFFDALFLNNNVANDFFKEYSSYSLKHPGIDMKEYYSKIFAKPKKIKVAGAVKTTAPSVDQKIIDNAKLAFDNAKADLNSISNKVYSGIWKEDVTPADYLVKKSKINAKKKYYEDEIAKLSSDSYSKYSWVPKDIAKKKQLLADLEDFEKQGILYSKAKDDYDKAKDAYYSLVGKPEKFSPNDYTKEAKKAAHKFTSAREADKFHRSYLDSIWDELNDDQKYSVWEYTHNSNPINKSLSGYHDTWSRSDFLGVGNADLSHEDLYPNRRFNGSDFKKRFGKDGHPLYKNVVQDLTTAIDKSELPEAVYLVRGSDTGGLAGLLEGSNISFDDAYHLLNMSDWDKSSFDKLKTIVENQTFTNHSFMSTGIAEGTGFSGLEVSYKIYAPAGTHGIYAEPTSYFGETISGEKLYKVGAKYSSVGGEAEVILQRGTEFRITNFTKNRRSITVEMEVVNQPDYFETGLEMTHNGGKTNYKK